MVEDILTKDILVEAKLTKVVRPFFSGDLLPADILIEDIPTEDILTRYFWTESILTENILTEDISAEGVPVGTYHYGYEYPHPIYLVSFNCSRNIYIELEDS